MLSKLCLNISRKSCSSQAKKKNRSFLHVFLLSLIMSSLFIIKIVHFSLAQVWCSRATCFRCWPASPSALETGDRNRFDWRWQTSVTEDSFLRSKGLWKIFRWLFFVGDVQGDSSPWWLTGFITVQRIPAPHSGGKCLKWHIARRLQFRCNQAWIGAIFGLTIPGPKPSPEIGLKRKMNEIKGTTQFSQ